MNLKQLEEALQWAKRNEYKYDLAEYASNDPENTIQRNYWQGQIDILTELIKQESEGN